MIICVCNDISDIDVKNNPDLLEQIGNCCGNCKQKEFVETK
jgi:hypothetical protein